MSRIQDKGCSHSCVKQGNIHFYLPDDLTNLQSQQIYVTKFSFSIWMALYFLPVRCQFRFCPERLFYNSNLALTLWFSVTYCFTIRGSIYCTLMMDDDDPGGSDLNVVLSLLAFDMASFRAFSCSVPQLQGLLALVSLLSGSDTVAKFGIIRET